MSDVIEAFPPVRRTPFDSPTPAQREAFLGSLQETARTPRHAPTVMVRERIEAGRRVYFALNPKAQALARFETGDTRKPFSGKLLELVAELGFNVEYVGGRL